MGKEVNKKKHYHTVIMYKAGRIDKYYREKKEDADGMYLMLKGLYPSATFHFGEEDIDVSKYK